MVDTLSPEGFTIKLLSHRDLAALPPHKVLFKTIFS